MLCCPCLARPFEALPPHPFFYHQPISSFTSPRTSLNGTRHSFAQLLLGNQTSRPSQSTHAFVYAHLRLPRRHLRPPAPFADPFAPSIKDALVRLPHRPPSAGVDRRRLVAQRPRSPPQPTRERGPRGSSSRPRGRCRRHSRQATGQQRQVHLLRVSPLKILP